MANKMHSDVYEEHPPTEAEHGWMLNKRECQKAKVPLAKVRQIARNLAKITRDAERIGLKVFGSGCGISLRFDEKPGVSHRKCGDLVCAEVLGMNCDGGDGGSCSDADGLLRGEC